MPSLKERLQMSESMISLEKLEVSRSPSASLVLVQAFSERDLFSQTESALPPHIGSISCQYQPIPFCGRWTTNRTIHKM